MRVAIYSRKSIETDKGDSIKNQIKMCEEYFNLRNDAVSFEIFEDEGFTGANINRPSFKLMMEQLNDFDVIAVYKIDRISRNVLDFLNTFEEFKKHNVKFISITENFDTESPMGKMMLLMLSGFAQMERENIAQRVKDNMRELAKSGKWTGGTKPFGYTTERVEENNKKATYLKLDDNKAELISDIFNYYISTESMHKTQKWLFRNGIKLDISSVKNILTSPIYVKANKDVIEYLMGFGEVFGSTNNINGIISYNKRPKINGVKHWNDKTMFYSISKHKGVIDASKWLQVQSIQYKNRTAPRPKQSSVSYLTGVLKCAKCGSPMTISYNHKNKDGNIVYVYLCTGRKSYGTEYCNCKQIKQTVYDEKFKELLLSYSKLPLDEFVKFININNKPIKRNSTLTIKKNIALNETKINNLTNKLAEASDITGKVLLKKLEMIVSENEDLKRKVYLIHQQELNSSCVSPKYIHSQLIYFLNGFEDSNIEQKRDLIKGFIDYIKYNSDTMNSEVKFL